MQLERNLDIWSTLILKKKVEKDLCSFITPKFSVFQMVKTMLRDKLQIDFQSIYIVFEPVKHYSKT